MTSVMDRQPAARLSTVRVEERDGAAVVSVRGHLDATSAPLLRDALAWAVTCHERVVIDLSRAETIDRTGLSVIIAAQQRARTRAVQLSCTAPSPQLLIALSRIRTADVPDPDATPGPASTEVESEASFTLPRTRSRLRFDGAAA